MTISWLMTIQEAATPSLALVDLPPGVEFDLGPRWISLNRDIDNEPSPHPNCFDTLQRWPRVVEIRRPDGTKVSAELYPGWVHINFPYALRLERNADGRIRNPYRTMVVLRGISVADVPLGSELWGEITDENLRVPENIKTLG